MPSLFLFSLGTILVEAYLGDFHGPAFICYFVFAMIVGVITARQTYRFVEDCRHHRLAYWSAIAGCIQGALFALCPLFSLFTYRLVIQVGGPLVIGGVFELPLRIVLIAGCSGVVYYLTPLRWAYPTAWLRALLGKE